MNEKNEIWKTYPEFDWIQGSNLGRVRMIEHYTLTKDGKKRHVDGHVFKQYDNGHGYMQITFKVNGKMISRYVHRIIAACFLTNPDKLPEVNHKNAVRNDNRVENLEFCSTSYNCQYRNKCGVSYKEAAKVLKKPLFAGNLETFKVLEFESQMEASRKLGVASQSINRVIKGKQPQVGGYYFSEAKNEVTREKLQAIKDKTRSDVIAISLREQEPLRFKNIKVAADSLGCCAQNISAVIKGRIKQIKGYWFCHADDNAVEATRAKFGDKVANKVAELMNEN